jgi:hypothetical protein
VKQSILFVVALFLAAGLAGCTKYQPPAAAPAVKTRRASYVLAIVIDMSSSFDELMAEKGFPFVQRVMRDFYRNRAGEDDVLIIGQVSALPVAPIFEGSPKSFMRLHGSQSKFMQLLKSKSHPSGSRINDGVADVARWAARYMTDDNQTFLCCLTDWEENFPEPEKSEARLVEALRLYTRPKTYVGCYFADLRFIDRVERDLKLAGVTNYVVRSGIEADPPMPHFE